MDEAKKQFETTLRTTLEQMKNAGRSQAEMQEATNRLYADFQKNVQTSTEVPLPNEPGLAQEIIGGLTTLPLKVGASGAAVYLGGRSLFAAGAERVANAFGNSGLAGKFAADKLKSLDELYTLATEGVDITYLTDSRITGKPEEERTLTHVKPMASAMADESKTPAERVVRSAADIGGTAAEGASYMVSLPPAVGIMQALRAAAPMAASFGAAKSLQAFGEGADVGEAAEEGLWTALAVEGGVGLLHTAGATANVLGRKLAKSAIGQKLNEVVSALMENVYQTAKGIVGKSREELGGLLRDRFDHLQRIYDGTHFRAIEEAGNILQVSTRDAADTAFSEWENVVGKAVDKKRLAFGEVFNSSNFIETPEFKSTAIIVKEAEAKLAMAGEKEMPMLARYLKRIQRGLLNKPAATLDEIDVMRATAPPTGNDLENRLIQDLRAALRRDTEIYLKNDNPNLYNRYVEAQALDKDIQAEIFGNPVAQTLSASRNINEFVGKLLDTGNSEGADAFFSRLSPETAEAVRDFFFNGVINRAETIGHNEGRKAAVSFLQKIYGNFADTTVLSPKNKISLRELGDIYQEDFTGFLSSMKTLLTPSEQATRANLIQKTTQLAAQKEGVAMRQSVLPLLEKGDYAGAIDKIGNIKSPDVMEALVGGLKNEEKEVLFNHLLARKAGKAKQLFALKEDGAYNMKGFFDDLNKMDPEVWSKIATPEQTAQIQKLYEFARTQDDLANVPSKAALTVFHTLAALGYLSFARPIGAVTHGGSAIMALFGNKLEPSEKAITNAIYNDLVSEGKTGFFSNLARFTEGTLTKKATAGISENLSGPPGRSPSFESYLGSTERYLGRTLTADEREQLYGQWVFHTD